MSNKHYIRKNGENSIIKVFSDAFEQPEESDVCVNEDGGRHFNMINGKPIIDVKSCFTFKYSSGKAVSRTQKEIKATTEYTES